MKKIAVVAGGGPAGLTFALEALRRTDVQPVVIESTDGVGGIARTFAYKDNRIDIGGHRFFSKSDRVMAWWQSILPLQGPQNLSEAELRIVCQKKARWLSIPADGPNPDAIDDVMLVRPRASRILYRGKLFDYPISASVQTLAKLGLGATTRIGLSYLYRMAFPLPNEQTLEQFLINRFGTRLYETFFQEYTEKVWGVPCSEISADWGAQRIKGLSLKRAFLHALGSASGLIRGRSRKAVETSLIEQFLYPKYGPGQIWEKVKDNIKAAGGVVRLGERVTRVVAEGDTVTAAIVSGTDGTETAIKCDYFVSTMAIKDLLAALSPSPPATIRAIGDGLVYRNFVTIGLLLKSLRLAGGCTGKDLFQHMPDNWIYVQEPGVKVGRLQFFNNWSPYMVADQDKVWIGLEYFCGEDDALWRTGDGEFFALAIDELTRIGIINPQDVVDQTIIRVPKTYPAYFGTYGSFDHIREYLNRFENLFPVGRNGMHRYNNQDHSMLTAMTAVDNIAAGRKDKSNIWNINAEGDYHEEN